MNLAARPAGGLLSDLLGSRKRTLTALLVGLVAGYALMATLGSAWPWIAAIAVTMFCSFFVQAGEGAVYAIVPLVKKRVSGQVAGMAGAMGNVGAVTFLTVGVLASEQIFFLAIAAASLVAVACARFLVEPENSFAHELLTDDAPAPGAVPRQLTPMPIAEPALVD
jgi:NNP family nitrate/nitrite transporter-like MFS transporter